MVDDGDLAGLRSLVVDTNRGPAGRSVSWRAVLVAVSVIVAAGSLFMLRSGSSAEPPADLSATVPGPAVPTPVGDPFDQLRYLPAGLPDELPLVAINRFDSSAAVALYERVDAAGRIDAVLHIDRVDTPMFAGVDGQPPESVKLGNFSGWAALNGSYHATVVGWTDEVGEVRAWGTGVELEQAVEVVGRLLTDPDKPDLGDGWSRSSTFEGGAAGRMIRYHVIDASGIAVATVAETPATTDLSLIDSADCTTASGRSVCADLIAWADDDGAELVVSGSGELRELLSERMRSVKSHNAVIAELEHTPWTAISPTEEQVLAPPASSGWVVETSGLHWSGAMVDEPGLVLVERTHPEIGRVTAGVIIELVEPGQPPVSAVGLDRASEVLVTELAGQPVRLIGWNHTQEELESLLRVMTFSPVDGLAFARRGIGAIGVERGYDVAYNNPFPIALPEGIVSTATLRAPSGSLVTQRVTNARAFVPAAVMIEPHDNSDLETEVQGRAASVRHHAGEYELAWSHEPGTVVELRGPDLAELLDLGGHLDWEPAVDLVASFGASGSEAAADERSPDDSGVEFVVDVRGPGSVDVVPALRSYPVGSTVRVFAVPELGSELVGFTIDGLAVEGLSTEVQVEAETEVVAEFGAGSAAEPGISFVYGLRQRFQRETQRWVNILGTADLEAEIDRVTYRLNGGTVESLTFGPDDRRLDRAGDFNIEIPIDTLRDGTNVVEVSAFDIAGAVQHGSMELVWDPTPAVRAPIDWSGAEHLLDVAQPIDGEWTISGGMLRTLDVGYERMVGIGDPGWSNYELTVPVTVHSIGPRAGETFGGGARVALGLNWSGHSKGTSSTQPNREVWPTGAFASYRFGEPGEFSLAGNHSDPVSVRPNRLLTGVTYLFKVRAEVLADGVDYSFKVWEQGRTEPAGWINEIFVSNGPTSGSVVLVAHHVDVSFGDVVVEALVPEAQGEVEEAAGTSVQVGVAGHGSVSQVPESRFHEPGSTVQVSAWPSAGQRFVGWTGDIESSEPTIDIEVGNQPINVVAEFTAETNGIAVWYGLDQTFGASGVAQWWINILGHASDPDGIASLTYRLNDGRILPLSLGTDLRRLYADGDFNVELDIDDLRPGVNTVQIALTDNTGETVIQNVALRWEPTEATLPVTVDWATEANVTSTAQVVDGLWSIVDGRLRTIETGYDRTVAIGDAGWSDYEVTVPVTIHSLGPGVGTPQSGQPLVGLAVRWEGHTETRRSQPNYGFAGAGGYAWWRTYEGSDDRVDLVGTDSFPQAKHFVDFDFDTTYLFKVQATTLDDGSRYRVKVWPEAAVEPASWSAEIIETSGPASGSILLIAHHFDVSFGPVQVNPVADGAG